MPRQWEQRPEIRQHNFSLPVSSPVKLLRELSDEQLAAVRNVRWWVDCGDDDFLYSCNIRFYALMRERNVPLQYRMRDGGHTWHYWRTGLEPILTFISCLLLHI